MAYVFEGDRTAFLTLLKHNPGVLIFKFTADWYSNYFANSDDIHKFTVQQIAQYEEIAKEKDCRWAS